MPRTRFWHSNTLWATRQYNISREAVSGYQTCDRDIVRADLQPGDICYIGGHVGIYIGGNQVVEARAHNYGAVPFDLAGRGWTSYGSLFRRPNESGGLCHLLTETGIRRPESWRYAGRVLRIGLMSRPATCSIMLLNVYVT